MLRTPQTISLWNLMKRTQQAKAHIEEGSARLNNTYLSRSLFFHHKILNIAKEISGTYVIINRPITYKTIKGTIAFDDGKLFYYLKKNGYIVIADTDSTIILSPFSSTVDPDQL